ncbi:Uncharacterised protein [Mycobacteroides abscessus subsp. abscessus]|nr:Uncharacterised protein [Mycobacteroides abscessus subsp. abscessus]
MSSEHRNNKTDNNSGYRTTNHSNRHIGEFLIRSAGGAFKLSRHVFHSNRFSVRIVWTFAQRNCLPTGKEGIKNAALLVVLGRTTDSLGGLFFQLKKESFENTHYIRPE